MPDNRIPEPWLSFLREIDQSLESEVSFHCFGGFAIDLQFDLPRQTSDIDVVAGVVRDKYTELFEFAGRGSPLHKKHKIYLDLVGAVATLPDDYEDRLITVTPNPFKHLQLYVMELHDIVLAKLNRNQPKDVQDVEYLAKVADLNPDILRDRYKTELRHNVIGPPERADGSLRYWIRSINEIQSNKSR